MTKKRKPSKKTAAKKTTSAVSRSAERRAGALSIATSSKRSDGQRVAAMREVPISAFSKEDNLQSLLDVLRNQSEPIEVRLAALQSVQAASFSVVAFEASRAEYLNALRTVAEDPDPELRQRVLGILARENDGFAQKKLLEGLQKPEKALVPPEKALQLLSYDVHSEAYPIARKIVNDPPNPMARREALRLLAADATAAPLFESILRNKEEPVDVRQLSASALHSLSPDKLQSHARQMLLDDSEKNELQATSLTALTQFGTNESIAKDQALVKRVEDLGAGSAGQVKQTARRFLTKFDV
jgi:hypothetical protein